MKNLYHTYFFTLFVIFTMILVISSWINPSCHAADCSPASAATAETADISSKPSAGALPADASADTSTPESCVESLHAALLDAMKMGDGAACMQRYRYLEPVISELFDFSLTSRLALGRYWKELSPEKRREFVHAFSAMSIATYAERFSGFSNEEFRTVETIQIKKNRVMVKTILTTSKGEEIPLDYTCVLSGEKWKIVTVTAKGVNDLALKRSEYTSFLKDRSIDELISFLREQTLKCAESK